jgi:hypothetical protein
LKDRSTTRYIWIRNTALLIWLALTGLVSVHACDSGDASCVCPTSGVAEIPEQPWTWVEESTIGGGPTNGRVPRLAATAVPHRHAGPAEPGNWKMFPHKFQDVVKDYQRHPENHADLAYYLGMVGVSTLLFAIIVVLIHRGTAGRDVRRLFQLLFLVLWVGVFAQCLCSVKDVAVLVAYARAGQWFYGLCTAWLALVTILFTLVLRRRFHSFYCFWACPVGTVQDLVETGLHRKMSNRVRIALLAGIAVVLVSVVAWKVPRPLNLLGGPVLALLMIAFAITAIVRPAMDRILRKFVFVSLAGWFALNLVVMLYDIENKTPGPWCVPGVANLRNPLVLTFFVLLAVSMIVPRAWCRYVCPNRGLFEALGGQREQGEKDATGG